jgi:hypothetical protein
MIQRGKLLEKLKPLVRDLEADLRQRFGGHPDYRARLTADWEAAREAGRTAEALDIWAEAQFTQSAVAWVLAAVFIRFAEDNGLLDAPLIAGADAHGHTAVARQEDFFRRHPIAGDNDYLRAAFAAEQARRKAEAVGAIPVPPKYKKEDFRDAPSWKLRGELDVPKERFAVFPGLERGHDPASPLLLWAGYDARARAAGKPGAIPVGRHLDPRLLRQHEPSVGQGTGVVHLAG